MKIKDLIVKEEERQRDSLMLIPSENYASRAVREAVGSVFANKYSEGYPGRRYYEGNEVVDELERYVQDLAKELFGVPYVNVQPYSGSPANAAVEMALLEPGETLMGLKLSGGGHLTHGHPEITFSGKFFQSVQYGVDKEGRVDFEELRKLTLKYKPKLIIAGTTSYPWILEWKKFREIADEVEAYLMADISHIAGLVVGGVHPSPVPYADIVTTTTHKTLRGPRGAMIMVTERGLKKDVDLPSKIDRAVFPGLQGGPHNHVTAGIGVALEEAKEPQFKQYAEKIVENAKVLAEALRRKGVKVWGTENHLMLLDFGGWGGGAQVAYAMSVAGMVANKNTVPHDRHSPFYPSGVRIGTPGVTTLGMGSKEMKKIADWIWQVVKVAQKWPLPKEKRERKEFMITFKKKMKESRELMRVKSEVETMMIKYRV